MVKDRVSAVTHLGEGVREREIELLELGIKSILVISRCLEGRAFLAKFSKSSFENENKDGSILF